MIPLAAVAGALLAVALGGEPTGEAVADVVLRALWGGATVAATVRARRVAWIGATTVVAVAGSPFGLAGLVLAAASVIVDRRSRVVAAAVGLLLVAGLLLLDGPETHGATALVGGLTTLIVAVSAYRRERRPVQRRWRRAAAAVAVAGLVVLVGFGLAALSARRSVSAGTSEARAGIAALRAGDQQAAAQRFAAAERRFRAARAAVRAPWALPARVTPLLAPQAVALDRATAAGANVAKTAAATALEASVDNVKVVGGAVDLAAVSALVPPLERAQRATADALITLGESDSPWLVTPLSARLDQLRDELNRARDQIDTSLRVARTAPGLLGAEGPRTYFLAIVTPSELRGSGGIIGNFGEIRAEGGKLSLRRIGRVSELIQASTEDARTAVLPAPYRDLYETLRPERFWQNATASAHFPTAASTMVAMYPVSGGGPVDGVVAVDPLALAALLEVVGPVDVPGLGRLTSANAAELLLKEQYVRFGPDDDRSRVDALGAAAAGVWSKLTTGTLPPPSDLARVLGPVTRGRHLQLFSPAPAEQALFRQIGAAGELPVAEPDALTVVTQNGNPSKIDVFLRRSYVYDLQVDPVSGEAQGTLTIRLENTAPRGDGPSVLLGPVRPDRPPPGDNRLGVWVYSALGFDGGTVDGQPLLLAAGAEQGLNVYVNVLTVPAGRTVTVVVRLRGTLDLAEGYRLRLGVQPTATPDRAEVRVRVGGRPPVERSFVLDQPRTIYVER